MALRKCPRCELNYIKDDAQYCNVCMTEIKRMKRKDDPEKEPEEIILCSECGEAPAVKGYDLCEACLKEQKRQRELEFAFDDPDESEEDDPEDEE